MPFGPGHDYFTCDVLLVLLNNCFMISIMRLAAFVLLIATPSEISFGAMEHMHVKWSFYYGKLLLMKGEDGATGQAELKVNESVAGELLITLIHQGEEPRESILTVRNDSGDVFEYQYEKQRPVDAFTPTVGSGSHFIIPIADVVGSVTPGHRSQLNFYYSADGNGEHHIGSITCIVQ